MKQFISLAIALAVSFFSLPTHSADSFPSKPVRIIVPYSAGGPVDIITRGLGARLNDVWKVATIVDNRPGANEIIGATELSHATPDGYTLLMATDSAFSQNQYLYKKLSYDPDAMVPVTRLALANLVLFVPSDFPASNMREFIAYARANPQRVNYGSAGIGNITHLSMAYVEKTYGLKMTHVPYKGLAPVIQDMLASQVQVAFGVPSAVEPFLRSGKLKALGISGAQRAKLLPTVPTFTESGYPDIESNLNMGLFAPRGTNAEVVNAIAGSVRKILLEPAFRKTYIDDVAFEVAASTPEEFAAFIAKDKPRQKVRIEMSGAKFD
ncbi:Bug family tripartite tricarboxylate transporter substrate binding protein [Variovorax paradoxus]|uniref:Bug family tripartite tricarboxylate transporter substrate binding protein n=1 Tax=Variovorax paradoxus TaxID=34073 RepID=UPI00035DA8BC|nr:tripartite tricarboxylate transporter substrate binding protein [Variovorax paradoxus]